MNSFGNSSQSLQNDSGLENLADLRNMATRKLTESGEHERLVKLLRSRLTECGWRDELAAECKRVVKEKGVDNVTVDHLVQQVQPIARRNVPDAIKQELVGQIRSFLNKALESDLK